MSLPAYVDNIDTLSGSEVYTRKTSRQINKNKVYW